MDSWLSSLTFELWKQTKADKIYESKSKNSKVHLKIEKFSADTDRLRSLYCISMLFQRKMTRFLQRRPRDENKTKAVEEKWNPSSSPLRLAKQELWDLPAWYSSKHSNSVLTVSPLERGRKWWQEFQWGEKRGRFFLWEHPVIILPQAQSREKWVFCVYGT